MKNIWKYLSAALLCMAAMASCEKDDSGKVLEEAYVTESIEFDLPDDIKVYIYVDENATEVLPLLRGNTVQLSYYATPNPDEVTFPEVKWTSSDESVATVSSTGVVTGIKAGTANITVAPSTPNYNASAMLKILVIETAVPATGITITDDAIRWVDGKPSCYIGENLNLSAAITPADATYKTVKWSSSNESIATVDMISGLVTGVSRGDVVITATALDATNPVSQTHSIYIDEIIEPIAIKLTNAPASGYKSAFNEARYTLTFQTYPVDCTRSLITWESSDPAIATVSNGVVTFTGFGSVNITATCFDTESEIPPGYDGYTHSVTVTFTIPAGLIREHFDDPVTSGWWVPKTNGTVINREQNMTTGEYYLQIYPNKSNANTYRGDNGANTTSYPSVYLHAGNYPIICLRFEDVNDAYGYSRNINLDTSGSCNGTTYSGNLGGNNNKWKSKKLCSDGSAIFVYDLSTQTFATGGALPTNSVAEFRTFQIKYADIRKPGNVDYVDGEDAKFKLYWIQTFESETDLDTHLNEWSTQTGITF